MTATYHRLRLTADELAALLTIGEDIRAIARGLTLPGSSVANAIARRGGLTPHSSIRALLAMDDLRRPQPATLEGLARGIGIPDRADAWRTLWKSIPHPEAR
jgi:hypothetical protein